MFGVNLGQFLIQFQGQFRTQFWAISGNFRDNFRSILMYLSIIFPLKISDMRKIQRDVEKQKKAAEMALNEDSMTELRVRVRDTSSGKILKGENAPLASELEAWLEKVCLPVGLTPWNPWSVNF